MDGFTAFLESLPRSTVDYLTKTGLRRTFESQIPYLQSKSRNLWHPCKKPKLFPDTVRLRGNDR